MAELKEKRKADPPRNVKDKKRREQLTDGVVKKTLYLMLNRRERGSIKTIQITPEMIAEKRAQLLAWREQRAEIPGPSCKVYFPVCSVCGHIFTAIHKNMGTCSDDCRKEKARQDNYTSNKAKKGLKERLCNECGELFAPEYGDKRRGFCSDVCSHRNLRRRRKQKERARMRNVKVESVSAMAVFERDGWRCQLCHRKLRRADRGTFKDAAPELDHIIPLSKGGEHSYRNTQCACRRCNAEKRGDERGQLRLFG